jgi:hypothetical protein
MERDFLAEERSFPLRRRMSFFHPHSIASHLGALLGFLLASAHGCLVNISFKGRSKDDYATVPVTMRVKSYE